VYLGLACINTCMVRVKYQIQAIVTQNFSKFDFGLFIQKIALNYYGAGHFGKILFIERDHQRIIARGFRVFDCHISPTHTACADVDDPIALFEDVVQVVHL
jgi:hypothetical protein